MAGFDISLTPSAVNYVPAMMIGLDSFVKLQNMPKNASPANKPQMEETMNRSSLNQDFTPEKIYLLSRVDEIYWSRREELLHEFHIYADKSPKTYAEMRDRLMSGKFTLPTDEHRTYVSLDALEWRSPEDKADDDGFAKAVEKLTELKTKARDEIIVSDLGLKALENFKSATVH